LVAPFLRDVPARAEGIAMGAQQNARAFLDIALAIALHKARYWAH
jgi:hypothetical protein